MLTTVVGSYPASPQEPTSFPDKISSFFGTYDEYKRAIALAVHDQIEAGIDIISDGQVRANMIEIFARSIPGMAVEDKTTRITSKILPSPQSIGALDLKLAIETARKISTDFMTGSGNIENNIKGVKGIVTGPSTLAFSCRIDGFYDKNKKKDVILDLAYALQREVDYLEDAGAMMIQIDEPFLSTGVVDIKTARNAINILTKNLSTPVSLHVCGNIEEVFPELLTFKVDIIDCEFAGNPQNLNVLENTDLKGKRIGFGCIDTKTDKIESLEQVSNLIKKGVELIGEENMLIDPDCGMRMRSRKAAFLKLKTMVEVVKWLS